MAFPITEAAVFALTLGSAGALLIAVGYRAPPPTALRILLGPKVGYAYVSPRAWTTISRVMGLSLLVIAASIPAQALILGNMLLGIAVYAEVIAVSVAVALYGRSVGERASVSDPAPTPPGAPQAITPIRPVRAWWITYACLALGTLLLAYATCLATQVNGVVVIHINAAGVPDRFSDSRVALYTLLAAPAALGAVATLTILLSIRTPEVFYRPWLRPSVFRKLVKLTQAALALAYVLASATVAYAVSLSAHSQSPIPFDTIYPLLAAYLAIIVYGTALGLMEYLRFRKTYARV